LLHKHGQLLGNSVFGYLHVWTVFGAVETPLESMVGCGEGALTILTEQCERSSLCCSYSPRRGQAKKCSLWFM